MNNKSRYIRKWEERKKMNTQAIQLGEKWLIA